LRSGGGNKKGDKRDLLGRKGRALDSRRRPARRVAAGKKKPPYGQTGGFTTVKRHPVEKTSLPPPGKESKHSSEVKSHKLARGRPQRGKRGGGSRKAKIFQYKDSQKFLKGYKRRNAVGQKGRYARISHFKSRPGGCSNT